MQMKRLGPQLSASVAALFTMFVIAVQPATASATEWLTLSPQQQPVWLELPALVEAVAQSTISAQTSGRIIELPFDVNDLVPQGAVVVRFTDTEQKARLAQAEAALSEAQVRFTEQDKELKRVQQIHQQGLVAKAALDLAQANFNAAKARQQQANAAVSAAREQLEQTVVRAPYSGILQQRLVELGELATPGKPLLTGLSLEHLRLTAQLPQQQLQAARQSRVAELQLVDGSTLSLGAPDLTIAPQGNALSHSFLLRLKLPVADYSAQQLYPGSWTKLKLQTGSLPQLLIPASAVLWRGEVAMVYLQQPTQPGLQPVRVQKLNDRQYLLLSGLSAGQKIALDAQRLVQQVAAPQEPQ
jgi:RND family efflux transporter MFP subunit